MQSFSPLVFCSAGTVRFHKPLIGSRPPVTHQPQHVPDISRLQPALQRQWDHAANASMGSVTIKPYSRRRASWICHECPDGYLHQWTARLIDRSSGAGCPQCCGRKVCQHNSLAIKAPWAAADWDFQANADLGTPDTILANSALQAHFRCLKCRHRWTTTPNARTSYKSGCPQCANQARKVQKQHPTFSECQHRLLAEWDHERNAAEGNYPEGTKLMSDKKIWWLCSRCNAGQAHSWSAMPSHRNALYRGCPFCAGKAACKCNSLQTVYPSIAAEWDHDRNTRQPSDYTASSHALVWWSTPRGESWQQKINDRTRGLHSMAVRKQRILKNSMPDKTL